MPDKATVDAWLSAASKTPDPVVTPPAAAVPEPVIAPTVADANDPAASSANGVSADPADPVEDGTSDATDDSSNPPADPSSDTPTDEQGDGKPRQRSAAQERIEELVTERNAFRKYGEHLLAHIEELKKGGTTAAPTTTSTGTAPPAANADSSDEPPTLEQFKFDPVEFSKAQSKWLKDQVKKQVADTLAAERGQQASTAATAKFIEREATSRAAHSDFDLMTSKNPNFPKLDSSSADLIVRSEIGPEIAYHLGKNPALAAKIEKMPRDAQIAAIGRIEGELTAKAAAPKPKTPTPPAKKTVTSAPPPPNPVRGSSNPTKQIHEMSMQEFADHERAQKLAQRQANLERRRAMR